jgi:hypothetical protein
MTMLEDLTLPELLHSIGATRWRAGTFTWPSGDGGEGVPVEDLLAHASRRLEELARIKTLVPSEDAVLVMAPQPPEGAVQINITPGEWRVLVMVDGHRPVREIAAAAGLDDLAAMKALYGLATAGLVTLASEPEPAPAPEHDTPLLEGVSDTTDMAVVSAVSDAPPEERVYSYPGETETEPDPEPEAEPEPEPEPYAAPASFDLPPLEPSPEVDRSTAARELAGLFDAEDSVFAAGMSFATAPPAPPRPRRLEDDDQVTRGLISRLIDGVKGL